MRFRMTPIAGVVEIFAEPHADARGLFARLFCPEEFATAELSGFQPVQMNLSRNPRRHTLRGMHYQPPPYAEAKLVRAVRGKAQDVVIDLRPDSPSHGRWTSVTLDADAMNALYVPQGCAHGFLTLWANTDILYVMGCAHIPGHASGVRWDDPAFRITWAAEPALMDHRDTTWPDWSSSPFTIPA